MNKKFLKIFFVLLLTGLFCVFNVVLAADQSPFIPDCLNNGSCDDVSVFVVLAISIGRYVFSFVGAVALLFFVYGGITMIISRGNKEEISKGTKAMTAAVVGLIVAFSGYALISFLGQQLKLKSEYRITKSEELLKI